MTSCLAEGCRCDCHVPPTPARTDLPSPELIALRKREALAAVEHARLKRTTATEGETP